MFVEEILRQQNNVPVNGTFLILDIKLKPFTEKQGHFLTCNLGDKTGVVWAKIWDNAESLAQQLKDITVVTIQGRTNIYNGKMQVIIEKIKQADSYDLGDLIKVSSRNPDEMWLELTTLLETNFTNYDYKMIWEAFKTDANFVTKFKMWPGGKGTVHHAYQHGLLEHTLSVIKIIKLFQTHLPLPFDFDKALLGGTLHDIGKLDAYSYDNIKIDMTNIGRLHEHTVLSYFAFRKTIEVLGLTNNAITEDVGHIILSHHGSKEQHAIIKPMTIEAKLVAAADYLDADTNYMMQQLEHNANDQGWIFDTLSDQFFFKRPSMKRRKIS